MTTRPLFIPVILGRCERAAQAKTLQCGAQMNHHALKIDYSSEGAALKEVHTCSECGRTELRQAE